MCVCVCGCGCVCVCVGVGVYAHKVKYITCLLSQVTFLGEVVARFHPQFFYCFVQQHKKKFDCEIHIYNNEKFNELYQFRCMQQSTVAAILKSNETFKA